MKTLNVRSRLQEERDQQFLADDRYHNAKRNDFNNWAKNLGITFTFVEAANPAPRIRLSSATGSLEMHLYREEGQAVGDASICDMELFRLGEEVIAQRMAEIFKVAEPLRRDCQVKGKSAETANMLLVTQTS